MGTKDLIGKPAPDFTIPDSNGTPFTLSEHIGKSPIAIFFFPKQGTPVCDAEACSFEKAYPDITTSTNTPLLVIGISFTPPAELKQWATKNNINYPILSDDSNRVARKAFQVGKALFGMSEARATFFLDVKGVVRGVLDGGMSFVVADAQYFDLLPPASSITLAFVAPTPRRYFTLLPQNSQARVSLAASSFGLGSSWKTQLDMDTTNQGGKLEELKDRGPESEVKARLGPLQKPAHKSGTGNNGKRAR
ncbi:hypothetical protein P7C70_g377, partial [Phenoliferia sp. Uapishka_3]